MTVAAVIGVGGTGAHAARQLDGVDDLLLIDIDATVAARVASGLRTARRPEQTVITPQVLESVDVVVVATPVGEHVRWAELALAGGAHVVSISDDLDEVRALIALDQRARELGRSVVVGAGFAPGLTCLLARHAGDALDEVVEIAIAKSGTGGPSCARQHHRAMKLDAHDWVDGSWVLRRGGSGRDLAWFPPPIGALDCYKASLPSPLLLQRTYPDAERISARVSATRRDRLTSRLPMLRPPHADGGPGAVRVEVRGRRGGAYESIIYAAMDHPTVAAGTVAAAVARAVGAGRLRAGAFGLSEVDDPLLLLTELTNRGLTIATFEGSAWDGS